MSTLVEAITGMLSIAWEMIISVKFPGSDIPIAVILVGAFVICFGIRIFAWAIGRSVNIGVSEDHMAINRVNSTSRHKGRY